jgi:ketosteroid isomerase-like protein
MQIHLLFGLSLLAAAGFAQADTIADNLAAEKEIRAALARWTEAANKGDVKATLSVWAPDLIGWSADGPDDTYSLEAEYAKQPPGPVKASYGLTINEVIVDGSLAVVRDSWTETTKQDSSPNKVTTFRSYEVWRRQSDMSWKISRWIDGPSKPRPIAEKK